MGATDSMPVPRKGVAFRLYFTVRDSVGALVTGFTSPDSEISKDEAAFTDCTNEATYVGRGQGYIDLTSDEMNADHVGFYFSCTEGFIEPISICPEEAGDIRGEASSIAAGAITATSIASGAITSAKFASGALDAVWTTLASALTTTGSIGKRIVDYLTGDAYARLGAPAGASVSADVAAIKADTAAILDDTGTSGVLLASSTDIYPADVQLTVDDGNTQDEWTVQWFKNGAPQTSGVTSPTIQVVKRADGTDLIASTAMTQIGSTGAYKYDASGSERVTQGEAVLVIVSATINAGSRSWRKVVTRDVEI